MEHPLQSFRFCPQCGREGFANCYERAKHCPNCGLTYFHNVAAAVACLVRDRAGQWLFVRRAKDPAKGTLDLTGGFVDPMETIEQAVARELKEETGLSPLSIHYLSSRPNRYPFSGITVYTADQFFLVEVEDCHKAVAQDDAAEIVITELGKLSAQDFGLESISHFMAELLSGQIKLPY